MTVTLVSSLTLAAIATNRWFVVCRPLKAKQRDNTKKTAVYCILGIWIFSLGTLCPVLFCSNLSRDFDGFEELSMLMSCKENWPSILLNIFSIVLTNFKFIGNNRRWKTNLILWKFLSSLGKVLCMLWSSYLCCKGCWELRFWKITKCFYIQIFVEKNHLFLCGWVYFLSTTRIEEC